MATSTLDRLQILDGASGGDPRDLQVFVLDLGDDAATRGALAQACAMARGLGASIRVLSLQCVSYALPLERPQVDLPFRIARLRALADADWDAPIYVDIRACRDEQQALLAIVKSGSIVAIGQRSWRGFYAWFGKPARLARKLESAGRQVLRCRSLACRSEKRMPQ